MIVDMFRVGVFLGFLLTCSIGLSETLPLELFPHSDSTYSCFRIPALVTLKSGVLVAFSEGRRGSCRDFGHVDILMRRSEDKGKTWEHSVEIVAGRAGYSDLSLIDRETIGIIYEQAGIQFLAVPLSRLMQ